MLRHIKLGVNQTFYFDYFGQPLPLRPISSYEVDDAIYEALRNANEKVAEFVVKIKLGLLGKKDNVVIDSNSYAEVKKYYNSIDYWFVFHAMKDFQDDEFTKPNYREGVPNGMIQVRKMEKIHEIASIVLNTSYQPKEVIEEIVRSDEGDVIAKIVFYLHQPLSSSLGDLTKLQRDFLIYAKINEKVEKINLEKSGDKRKLAGIVGNVNTDR